MSREYIQRTNESKIIKRMMDSQPQRRREIAKPKNRCMDGVNSAQDRDYWRALLNATLKLRIP
jgi:hypothetical protein